MTPIQLERPRSICIFIDTDTTDNLMLNTSTLSIILSHVTGILIILRISPGLNVTLTGFELKSTPDPKKMPIRSQHNIF